MSKPAMQNSFKNNGQPEKKEKIYFPGLNGLRFLAAFVVIVHHIEEVKWHQGLPNCFLHPVIERLGPFAVAFFFVLSAFLITYLLLAEYGQTNAIHVREFYFRRILRIWPLYYLIVAIAFFVLPHFVANEPGFELHFWALLTAHVILLPNFLYMPPIFVFFVYGAQQLWSIGIEEQFYIIWPVLTKLFIKNFWKMLFAIIICKLAFHHWGPFVLRLMEDRGVSLTTLRYAQIFYRAVEMIPYEKMGVGALGAYAVFHKKERLLRFLYQPITQVMTWIAMIILFVAPDYKFLYVVQGVVFTLLIMNVSCNPKPLLKLENKYLNYLGKISYGIYMYHSLTIIIAALILEKFMAGQGIVFNVLLYASSMLLTLAVSALSYRYYESYFLTLKKKVQFVASGG